MTSPFHMATSPFAAAVSTARARRRCVRRSDNTAHSVLNTARIIERLFIGRRAVPVLDGASPAAKAEVIAQ